jgi:hypothetical protein
MKASDVWLQAASAADVAAGVSRQSARRMPTGSVRRMCLEAGAACAESLSKIFRTNSRRTANLELEPERDDLSHILPEPGFLVVEDSTVAVRFPAPATATRDLTLDDKTDPDAVEPLMLDDITEVD